MTNTEMFGEAKWVACNTSCSSPYMRREFSLDKISNAQIVICGLGFFELYVNGIRVSDDLLVPANSQYEKRGIDQFGFEITDSISFRVYCMKYDVAKLFRQGKNAIGIRLGGGWYDQQRHRDNTDVSYGKVKVCYRLNAELEDGRKIEILSDEATLWKQSEILANCLYHGEVHDYSLLQKDFSKPEFDASDWNTPKIVDAPDSNFYIQTSPSDKIIRTVEPRLVRSIEGRNIYDTGEAVSGYALVKSLLDGETITVRYADELYADGELNFDSTGGNEDIQQEVFKNTSAGHTYFPRFCWHAFRFFEIDGEAKPTEVRVIHSDCPVTSEFDSDCETLNWLYKAYLRTQLDNMHCGVPSDCPHIERYGYTGDGQLCAEAAMLMLDSREFYRKWMEDIADCQDVNTGHVQHTAPFMGGGGGPAAWGGAIVNVPYVFYRCYGEIQILERYFPKMLKYFDYMFSQSENGLVCREGDNGRYGFLGDWCAPAELFPEKSCVSRVLIPEAYVNTALLVKLMQRAVEIAEIIGKPEFAAHLPEKIEQYKHMLKIAYFNGESSCFCGDVQGANSFALDIGLGNRETFEITVDKYKKRGMFDTGIIATDVLPRILFENGEQQLAFDLLNSKGYISFYNMMKHGATTLWEDWYPKRSLNHPMFGAVTKYLFTYLLGIGQTEDSAGFEKVCISPRLVDGMNRAFGYITSVRGRITVSYVKVKSKVDFTVTLDKGMNGIFRLEDTVKELTEGKNKITVEL